MGFTERGQINKTTFRGINKMGGFAEQLKEKTNAHPAKGKRMKYTDGKNRSYIGVVKNIARVRSGAVLAWLVCDDGQVKGCPVSRYGWWEDI